MSRWTRLALSVALGALTATQATAVPAANAAAPALPEAVSVSSNFLHTCALLTDAKVACWGYNSEGELGDGTQDNSATPVVVAGLSSATQVYSGFLHTCALITGGNVSCWGYNGFGELGDFADGLSSLPVPITGVSGATQLALGYFHTCALLATGRISCWGSNSYGQLGDGTTDDSTAPATVAGITTARAIAAGPNSTCALLASGQVSCWGANSDGQLGNGTNVSSPTPVAVTGISNATSISAGFSHTCARLSTGRISCWGNNFYGQLGDGLTANSTSPVSGTAVADAATVSAGGLHTCAIRQSGQVLCWGYNGDGELGNGQTLDSLAPVTVSGVAAATTVSASFLHTCVVLSSGRVGCWGSNSSGQLGNGTQADSLTMSLVSRIGAAQPPAAPTGVSATAGVEKATISWSAPADDGGLPITGYQVSDGDGHGCSTDGDGRSCVVSGLTGGVEYTFAVTAANSKGAGTASAAVKVTPKSPATAPGAPADVAAVAGDGQVGVSWSAPASDGGSAITGYLVSDGDGHGCTTDGDGRSCVVMSLTNGVEYSFTVSAVNAVGTGSASAPASATPKPAVTVPGAPTEVSATAGIEHATVSWSAPADNGGAVITGYEVSDGNGHGCSTDGDGRSCVVSGLTGGVEYSFAVTASNVMGAGPSSEPAQVTAQAQPRVPAAPTGLSAVRGDGRATVSWTAPEDDGGAAIESYTATVVGGSQHCTIAAPATSCVVTGLSNRTRVAFTVSAENSVGSSASSAPSDLIWIHSDAFQVFVEQQTLVLGEGTTVHVWGAPAGKAVTLRIGGLRYNLAADLDGHVQQYYIADSMPGNLVAAGKSVKVSALAKVGGKSVTVATALYVPQLSVRPTFRQGKPLQAVARAIAPGSHAVIALRNLSTGATTVLCDTAIGASGSLTCAATAPTADRYRVSLTVDGSLIGTSDITVTPPPAKR